ncbi:MAG: YiiD C-terminal domain-containing protein [Pseudomonadota bacterium]
MSARFDTLFALWSEQIPLAKAMEIRFEETSGDWSLQAPLEPNRNHMGTAFGGAIASLATLTGWAQTWMLLPNPEATHIVVGKSTIQYRRPARGELIGTAQAPSDDTVSDFLASLDARGKAGIHIVVQIHSDGVEAARLKAKFVAIQKSA